MTAPAKKSRKWLYVGIIVVIAIVVLLIPPLLAGGFNVKVSTVTFKTVTGSLYFSGMQASTAVMTAYQYYLTVRTGGVVRTDEGNTSTTRGTANVTMHLSLMTPSNQTVDLGTFHFTGGIGTRTHTLYLSFEQSLSAPGEYTLSATMTGDVQPAGGLLQINLSASLGFDWIVS